MVGASADYAHSLKAENQVRILATLIMMTGALQTFLDQVGKVVHHLNTIAVGLSAVETGVAKKPHGLDVSWSPQNLAASARQARAFVLQATIISVAEEIGAYVLAVSKHPGVMLDLATREERSEKLLAIKERFCLEENELYLGPLLTIHWRNRIIHRASNAGLTKREREKFIGMEQYLRTEYKNLDPQRTLEDFAENKPSLKDVSSLVAMSIRFAKRLSELMPSPSSAEEVKEWIARLSLESDLDRVRRVGAAKGKEQQSVRIFLMTRCPCLVEPYFKFVNDFAS